MGTRGYIGFRLNNQDKGVYNHNDSYPSWTGKKVIAFVKYIHLISELTRAVSCITLCDDEDCIKSIVYGYEFLDTISNYKLGDQIIIEEYSGFLQDSLFCEWAYIINLDSNKLEIYKGFNNDPHANGRYSHLKNEDIVDNEYYGVELLLELPFDKIKSMANDRIFELCDIIGNGNGNEIESYLQTLPRYNLAKPPTITDRIQLLELM